VFIAFHTDESCRLPRAMMFPVVDVGYGSGNAASWVSAYIIYGFERTHLFLHEFLPFSEMFHDAEWISDGASSSRWVSMLL
jgi:hypothetical protein